MRLSLAGVASGELESTRDNLLGRLYEPDEVASFEGVADWAEHRPEDGVVRYGIAPNMNTPNPDSGRGAPHINTQLFGILDEENRGKIQAEKSFNEPRGAPSPSGGTAAGGGTWS
jgi:phospholipase C